MFAFLHSHILCASPICLDQICSSILSLLFLNILWQYWYFPVSSAIFYFITILSQGQARFFWGRLFISLLKCSTESCLGNNYTDSQTPFSPRVCLTYTGRMPLAAGGPLDQRGTLPENHWVPLALMRCHFFSLHLSLVKKNEEKKLSLEVEFIVSFPIYAPNQGTLSSFSPLCNISCFQILYLFSLNSL